LQIVRLLDFSERLAGFRETLKFPSDEDLNGAAVALMRLQDTYHLNTASVARGELNGVQYSTEMTGKPNEKFGSV
jgi:prolyl 4-hydroxylase